MNPLLRDALKTLVTAAVRAPSGDNTQPWRVDIDIESQRLSLQVDPSRDQSPMNAGQRMARIAVGAALENVLRTMAAGQWSYQPDVQIDRQGVAVHWTALPETAPIVEPAIFERVTNRRLYDGRPVPAETRDLLQAETQVPQRVAAVWITDRPQVQRAAKCIAQADRLMFGVGCMRRAFLDNVRFDAQPDAATDEGLPLGSLELPPSARPGLKLMRAIPDPVLKYTGGTLQFARHASRLVGSASGLCVIGADDDEVNTDFEVGRAMQQAWLTLTKHGFAVQPMMSIPVLGGAVLHGPDDLRRRLGPEKVAAIEDSLRDALPDLGARRPAFIMRFGFAPPPTARTGRIDLVETIETLRQD